jgi:hypothetical protein
MRIIDEWKNAKGERVVLTDTGLLQVEKNSGQMVSGAALNAKRCDRAAAPQARPMVSQMVHNVGSEEVIELPFMAIKPYYDKQAGQTKPQPVHNVAAQGVTELPFMAIKPYYAQQK